MKRSTKSKRTNKLKTIKHHNFAGNKYRVVWEKPVDEHGEHGGVELNGLCEEPSAYGRKITIDPNLEQKELLKTAIDESIHASLWALDNEFVDKMSESIGEFLWRMGYRIKE